MLSLSQSRALRYLTFGALYLAQGLPAGFLFVLYVVFLTDQGLSNAAIGATVGIMTLPWTFKIVWAVLMDRVGTTRLGRRRPFILLAELGMGLTLLALLALDPRHDLQWVRVVLFLHALFTSIQDTATDGLAVELLRPDERGSANGVMAAAKAAGVALSGGVGPLVVRYLGFSGIVILLTVIVWTVMILVLAVRERAPHELPPPHAARRLTLSELRRSFAFSAPLIGIGIAFLVPLGPALIGTVFTRLLRSELKLSVEFIGTLAGILEPSAAIAGGLVGGILADRFGLRRVAGLALLLFSAALATFGLLPSLWSLKPFLIGCSIVLQLASAAANAVLVGLYMRLTNPAIGAVQIALFTAMPSLSAAIAAPLGGQIADAWGSAAVFQIAAVLQFVFIGLLPFCNPRAAEARFHAEHPADLPTAPAPDATPTRDDLGPDSADGVFVSGEEPPPARSTTRIPHA